MKEEIILNRTDKTATIEMQFGAASVVHWLTKAHRINHALPYTSGKALT